MVARRSSLTVYRAVPCMIELTFEELEKAWKEKRSSDIVLINPKANDVEPLGSCGIFAVAVGVHAKLLDHPQEADMAVLGSGKFTDFDGVVTVTDRYLEMWSRQHVSHGDRYANACCARLGVSSHC